MAAAWTNLVAKITSGEKRGEPLQHEFIALAGPVTRRGSHVPVQAMGGWLD